MLNRSHHSHLRRGVPKREAKVFFASEIEFSQSMAILFAVLVFCIAQEFVLCVPLQKRGMKFLQALSTKCKTIYVLRIFFGLLWLCHIRIPIVVFSITILDASDEMIFEGDMIMPVEEVERAIRGEDLDASSGRARGARTNGLWRNAVVPYVFSKSVSK